MREQQRVVVLRGGWSPERAVSLMSGAAALAAIQKLGHEAIDLDITADTRPTLAQKLQALAPDLVFNALHGAYGEDGCVQGVLEVLGIPYTHSGVLASALAMDKDRAKQVMRLAGLPVAPGQFVRDEAALKAARIAAPYVVKPNASGSSVGIEIVPEGDNRSPEMVVAGAGLDLAAGVLIEKFIPGRELTTAVMGDRALDVTEITPHNAFYDYEAKYAAGGSSHMVPAEVPDAIREACLSMALAAHDLLGCRGITRTDFIYDEKNRSKPDSVNGLFILEINTQPGLTSTSLVPEQAGVCGLSFEGLIAWMIGDASCRR